MKDKKIEQVLSGGGYQWGGGRAKGEGQHLRSGYMVDVFCIPVWKQNNETCWNCSKKGREDESNKDIQ
jgi:hypothetical protein